VIEVRCHASFLELAGLQLDIDAVNRLSARPDAFSTFAFLENFWRHEQPRDGAAAATLWFLTAFREGRLLGYLPLQRTTRKVLGMPVATVGFLVTHDTDRPHAVARPEHLRAVSAAFYEHLIGRRQEWSLLEFQQQDDSSSLFPPPVTVDLKHCLVREWPSMENCTIGVRWASLEDYFAALARKFQSNLARQTQGLFALGRVECLASSDPAVTPALLKLYLGIEARSWKSQAQANIARHPGRIAYVEDLLESRQPMKVSIQLLLLDGIPIAGLVNGAFEKSLHALHIVYDERLARLGPGSVMLLLGMRQAIAGGFERFNLLSGFQYYKVRWLAQVAPTRIAQIYRVASLWWWRRLLGDLLRRAGGGGVKAAPAGFNPTRRGSSPEALDAPAAQTSPAQRAQIAALIADVRAGDAEFLSMPALAAVLPFETRRPARSVLMRGPAPRGAAGATTAIRSPAG